MTDKRQVQKHSVWPIGLVGIDDGRYGVFKEKLFCYSCGYGMVVLDGDAIEDYKKELERFQNEHPQYEWIDDTEE